MYLFIRMLIYSFVHLFVYHILQLHPTLCDIMARQASLSIINSWSLLKLSIKSVMPSNHLILFIPFSSCLQSLPASRSFPMSQSFASGGQSIGVSASASVFPMNIQHWFPLGLTGLISLQSKGFSRIFSSATIWKQFYSLCIHNCPITIYRKSHPFLT